MQAVEGGTDRFLAHSHCWLLALRRDWTTWQRCSLLSGRDVGNYFEFLGTLCSVTARVNVTLCCDAKSWLSHRPEGSLVHREREWSVAGHQSSVNGASVHTLADTLSRLTAES